MTIKRYLVKDMNEAMVRIRYELGSDAIIVSSRWIRQKGLRNLFKRKLLEVTAAVDRKLDAYVPFTQPQIQQLQPQPQPQPQQLQPQQPHLQQTQQQLQPQQALQPENQAAKENGLEDEIKELKKMVTSLMEEKNKKRGGRKKQFSTELIAYLKSMDLEERIIDDFSAYCKGIGSSEMDICKAKEYFLDILSRNTLPQEKANARIWAFIGPTGVGKTTTIAKIAAREALESKKKVGLITMDTYRIGAVEQLRIYANIMNIPLEVVSSREDLVKAIDSLSSCDLILIDSAGRNSLNKEQLAESKSRLDVIENKQNILVVSATTRNRDLKTILENYGDIGYDSIILTKIDETQCYGNILNIHHHTDKPICYITTGQTVPEDIVKVSAESLLDYVLMGVTM